MTSANEAYQRANKRYRLQRSGNLWAVLAWRPGLGVWEVKADHLRRRMAVKERACLVFVHALRLMSINPERLPKLLLSYSSGPVRERLALAHVAVYGL